MESKRACLFILLVLFVPVLPACRYISGARPTSTPSVTPTPAITPTPVLITPTPMLMCTPPPCQADEVYHCPGDCPGGCGTVCATPTPDGSAGLGPVPGEWAELGAWLTAAWQANENPAAIRHALQQAEWQESYEEWAAADFDGDLKDEWVLVLYPPSVIPATVFGKPGNLWVVNGNGVIYRYYESVDPDSGQVAPAVVGVADLTGDNLPELVIDEHTCGAHTCFGNYQILSSRDGSLQNIVERTPTFAEEPTNVINMSYPDTRFVDHNQDGLMDFLVHGGNIGSVGAGIVRTRTEVWSWSGTAVTLAETILDFTEYRHHILYEANDLMAEGELDQALSLYEQAIDDTTLITPEFLNSQAETYAAISQFATFRLILIDLLQGDMDNATSRLTSLTQNYPETATTQAATTLVNDWAGAESMASVCAAIETDLEAFDNPTGALADLGYGNPSLTGADYCP